MIDDDFLPICVPENGHEIRALYKKQRVENATLTAELEALKKNYNELLYQVQNKIPNETRHETAKRIIHQHETRPSNPTGDK